MDVNALVSFNFAAIVFRGILLLLPNSWSELERTDKLPGVL